MNLDYDYIIIGSGFGGSVSALRLTQKGYRVAVIEAGKRFQDHDFAKSNWDLKRFLWLPRAFCYGIQRLNLLNDVMILSGAGVGGGSLVYANTLYVPSERFFEHPTLQAMGGSKGLLPYYYLAQKMLGVIENPKLWPADEHFRETAKAFGAEDTFKPTPVGVFFGNDAQAKSVNTAVPDPYFAGEGPDRNPCSHCGACMVGCRHGAKNTLVKNYLYLAEQLGATIIPETEVTALFALSADGTAGYRIKTRRSTHINGRPHGVLTARGIVCSAGVMGSLNLLLQAREKGWLPRLSQALGQQVRTNSEAILGAISRDKTVDHSRGIAITSSIYPDEHSHIEPVRYPAGSDAMGLLATLLTDGGGKMPRQLRFVANILRQPLDFVRMLSPRGFAKQGIIVLFMQTLDNSLKVSRRRVWWRFWRKGLSSSPEGGVKAPSYIPLANDFTRKLAEHMNAVPGSSINEVLLDVPTTAHILGGCSIGSQPEQGVIDLQHQAFGYANLLVCDGSMIPANLGVNPSLTITALTERAMSFVPLKPGSSMRWLKVDPLWDTAALILPLENTAL
jgi:cholesterol oxidase